MKARIRDGIGAVVVGDDTVRFRVWAPRSCTVSVRIRSAGGERILPLEGDGFGYFSATVEKVREGDRYLYLLEDGSERPDPASRFQPDGVHAPSAVVNSGGFRWTDAAWRGLPLEEYVICELHVGTFTREGTFDAVITMLDYLRDLGITAVELMPVAQFPGERNWGYDGVYPFAPQNSYGGPDGLRRLVQACHLRGMAVVLDVVYNHLGPEGNYLHGFGPYFTDRYRTPWGEAVNFDGPESDPVRRYFIDNALHWVREYHIDALRLDAIHGIFDFSARHFLEELAAEVHAEARLLGREVHVIAESDLNDARIIRDREAGGDGLDAQWNDDFHHALHTLLTGQRDGYYVDFGDAGQLARALTERYVYSGRYSAYRRRRHGNSAEGIPARRFVVFAQNHDQIGNRMMGERLSSLVSFESLKLSAAAVLLSPYLPLLFMGEEYGEDAPFLYFVSHTDPDLTEAVRTGRKEEFASFLSRGEPPDPGAVETFLRSRPDPEKRNSGNHAALLGLYRELFRMRREIPALSVPERDGIRVSFREREKTLSVLRWKGESMALCLFNFGADDALFDLPEGGRWRRILDTADTAWNGPGVLPPGEGAQGDAVVVRGRGCSVYLMERP